MSAQVKWREDRNAWFLVVYDAGSRRVKRLGPTLGDKRRGDRRAKEWNDKRLRGAVGLEKPKPKPVPFDEFARRWLRTKVQLPIARGLKGAVAPKTAQQRDQAVRLHLVPHLGAKNVRNFDIETVDWLWEHYLELGKPRSQRSMEIALGVFRLILADAVRKKLLVANPVDQWKATAKADFEYLYDRPYEDRTKVRVGGPFTVDSLSPHRVLAVDENDELIHGIDGNPRC